MSDWKDTVEGSIPSLFAGMGDPEKADRARAAYEHAVRVLPDGYRLHVKVNDKSRADLHTRWSMQVDVELQRRGWLFWRTLATAEAVQIAFPNEDFEMERVVQVGRYTGRRVQYHEFYRLERCEGHVSEGEEEDVEVYHVRVVDDLTISRDEVFLNCALAGQDLALEAMGGETPAVVPPYDPLKP